MSRTPAPVPVGFLRRRNSRRLNVSLVSKPFGPGGEPRLMIAITNTAQLAEGGVIELSQRGVMVSPRRAHELIKLIEDAVALAPPPLQNEQAPRPDAQPEPITSSEMKEPA